MRSLFKKIFGSPAGSAKQAGTPRDPARCTELRKRGNALLAQGMLDEAGHAYRAATQADPYDAIPFVNLGYVLYEQKDLAQARKVLRLALENDPDQCDAHFMLATVEQDMGDVVAATRHIAEVLRVRPDFDITAYFSGEDLHEKALERCRIILSVDPKNALAHRTLGMTSLLLGDYEQGWREYQWRFSVNVPGQMHKTLQKPLWLGESSIDGKTILVHWEQGFGDTLQFCRYVREVALLGAKVVLQVQVGLGGLLANLEGASVVLEEKQPLPVFDVYCPLLSLPLALEAFDDTRLYGDRAYLHADPGKTRAWQQRLEVLGFSAEPRIGVMWSGSRANQVGLRRSISLNQFVQVLGPDCKVVSLQQEVWETDAEELRAEERIIFVGAQLTDFAETAALIAGLDLVITIDTSVAHLAGAMGKPVWVLLHKVADWRWLLDRDDCPWYPNVRLFRQQVADDWSHPLQAVRKALAERIQSGK